MTGKMEMCKLGCGDEIDREYPEDELCSSCLNQLWNYEMEQQHRDYERSV